MSEARAQYTIGVVALIAVGDPAALEITPAQYPFAAGGEYTVDAQFTGGPLTLQALGADGVTRRTVSAIAASGTLASTIKVGQGTRLFVKADADATGVSVAIRQVL